MSLAIVLAFSVGAWPFKSRGPTVTSRYTIPAWHVDATRDPFTDKMVCRVYQGDRRRPVASYQRSTLAFRFARHIDTTSADFRVDAGTTQPWTAVYPTLIGSGAALAGRSLTNPTGGLVILPVGILRNATTVTIRATPRSRPKVFSVGGLGDAFGAARRLGCDADYGFAR